jgi:hypothetical protein
LPRLQRDTQQKLHHLFLFVICDKELLNGLLFRGIGLEASGAVATVNGAKSLSVVVLMLPMLFSFPGQRVAVAEQDDQMLRELRGED